MFTLTVFFISFALIGLVAYEDLNFGSHSSDFKA